MKFFETWRMKRIIRLGEVAKKEIQYRCLHDWRYIGTKAFESYNGIEIDIDTYHMTYCPLCEKENKYWTKKDAEQEVLKSVLRKESKR